MQDFSSEAIAEMAARVKRELEREFKLPFGACDRVDNDLLRLFVWRDEKTDPGPLVGLRRQLYMSKYFEEGFAKRRAAGVLIFRSDIEAERCLLDHSFVRQRQGVYARDDVIAHIIQTGGIVRIVARNTATNEVIDNEQKL